MASDGHEVDDISYRICVGTFCTAIPATIAVLLRFVSRRIAKAGLWWDDWIILASLVVNWAMAATRWAQVLLFGFGQHGEDLTKEDTINFQKLFGDSNHILYERHSHQIIVTFPLPSDLWGSPTVSPASMDLWWSNRVIACTIAAIAGCSPVSHFWDRSSPGSCMNEIAFFRWNGIANMLLDILMLILPIPMVWRMKTSRKQKMLLSGIFLMGGFVCLVSLLRIVTFSFTNRTDPTYSTVNTSMWSSIEQSVGILCACLPTLRPLRQLWSARGNAPREASPFCSQSRLSKASTQSGTRSADIEAAGGIEVVRMRDEQSRSLPAAIYAAPSLLGSDSSIIERQERSHSVSELG